jgi:hypothetical protein
MINYHTELVRALSKVLPTHYEMTLTSKNKVPCISYMEANNYTASSGDTVGYSYITYQVKVWANDIATIQQYTLEVDKALRAIGFKRISATELYDNNSTMIQKILMYEALASENYKED